MAFLDRFYSNLRPVISDNVVWGLHETGCSIFSDFQKIVNKNVVIYDFVQIVWTVFGYFEPHIASTNLV